jgi:hypothetical protein
MRENTYITNTPMRDLSRASWWYKNQNLISSIHTSASHRCKSLSLTRAVNIKSPSAVALMYHLCNSRILVGSMFVQQLRPHKRVLHYKWFSSCAWVNQDWNLPSKLSFCEFRFRYKLDRSFVLFWKYLEWRYRLLGLFSELGNIFSRRLLFFWKFFVIERS